MDINLHKFYVVEKRLSGMSVLPFGFKTSEAAAKAIVGFTKKRQAYMSVHPGDKLPLVRENFFGRDTKP
jgi:hypothetical protein